MSFVPKISAGQAARHRTDLIEALGIPPGTLDDAIARASDPSDPFFDHVLAACAYQHSDLHPMATIERARMLIAYGDADAVARIAGIPQISDMPGHMPSTLFDPSQHPVYPYSQDPEVAAARIFLVFRDRDLSSEPRRVLYGNLGDYLDRLALSGCSVEEVETILDDILTNGRHVGFGLVGTTMEIVGLPRAPEPQPEPENETAPSYFLQPV